ncbi:VWA domain-containing protein [Roseiflexus castenholzii]|uniref:von Willebrand factor, type A n=1 Tax=Roseiflexus castenholzii (strain DSM 13941 / HLO8) TaxID=383372 RepID=A7NL41_ROSCS|nr:VWA domain-containing protein [Roseiflexus castenholzii]ABU58211.1 von Willebrand factor, type A [Roseiflexus castenholzii DSM 13941]
MRRLFALCAILGMLTLLTPSAYAQSQGCRGIEVHAAQMEFPNVVVQFSVCDAAGNRIAGIDRSAIRLTEDGRPVADFDMESIVADAQTPVQSVALSNGGASFMLTTTGASIGIVFDATQLLNGSGAQARNSIGEGRAAIEAFLLEEGEPPPPRTRSPGNIEHIGLFIPVDQPDQSLQPETLPAFTQDRYAVINTLRQSLPIRQKKTSLNAAIQSAIEATARDAQQRGAEAAVLVVSDGGDALTGDTFTALIAQAQQRRVRIVAFGFGTDKALQSNGFRLKQLAEATGGIYLERPNARAAGDAFLRVAEPRPAALYRVRYSTQIIDDGKPHSLELEVNAPDRLIYQFPLTYAGADSGIRLTPLGDALLRQYFVFAVPIALFLSLFLTLISGAMFWLSTSSSGLKGKTQR